MKISPKTESLQQILFSSVNQSQNVISVISYLFLIGLNIFIEIYNHVLLILVINR